MTFLPIVERELRVAARRRGTYWLRSGVALAVVGLGAWIYLAQGQWASPAQISMSLFIGLTIVAGLFCLGAGARATADSLSEEKRDGTLGLLFLTDLRGYDVVVGKLVACSLNTFYGLLAVLPVLAIPLLMGGVTGAEFGRMASVLLNTLFFSLAAGMFTSAFVKSSRHAAGLCSAIVLGLAGLLPLVAVILASIDSWHHDPSKWLLIPSPGYAFVTAFDTNYRGNEVNFLISIGIAHALAWLFLVLACLRVPRSWQDRAATLTQLRWRDRWLRWTLGSGAQRAWFRARLLDVNAFYWLAARARHKPALVWAALGALGGAWLWFWFEFGTDWLNPITYFCTAFFLNALLKSWFAGEACAQLAEDRRTGALELLLSTPLGVRDVLQGQFKALARQFFAPLAVVLLLEITLMIAGLVHNEIRGEGDAWVLMWVCGLTMLVADLAALFPLCLWRSLTARSATRAQSGAVMRILALPWILFAGFMMLVGVSGGWGMGPGGVCVIWLFIGLGVDAFYGFTARANLESRFREVATTRFTPRVSIWQRWFTVLPRPEDAP
jgi:hypothetical protein